MDEVVRVGLLGLGHIAQTHLQVLAADKRVALDFTVDPNVADAPLFREARAPHYHSLKDALTKHQPELIVIATPTDSHMDLVAEALTRSTARVLVEKPLVHDVASLDRLCAMADVRGRVFTAHHFAFSPEVEWAALMVGEHEEWGPVTEVTAAFHDPYVLRGRQAFTSYGSSWTDSGINQLSVVARLVEPIRMTAGTELDDGASAWCTFAFTSRGRTGTARLRTSWRTGASSKETVAVFDESGVELWIDHTAMTGFAAQGTELLATYGNDGRTPRKVAHYERLYDSLLSDHPHRLLRFDAAEHLTRLHRGVL
ncbi:Gfo/Idh/MocA family protein [Yinghuangia sp. YIM S10712]|uniref:Gfo/Idh/MocA family protein n=1 Tax=Yinghuangia sp. YIM S10712 TaxID=3436930 RepID=UPI003F539564